MRNFFAIIKDSYREAKNGWVLQTLAILVLLMLILVFSVSFRQLTMQESLEARFILINRFLNGNPNAGSPTFSIENATTANPVEPWASSHRFEFVVTCPSAKDLRKADEIRLPVTQERVEQFVKQLDLLKGVSVRDIGDKIPPAPKKVDKDGPEPVEAAGPAKVRFLVTADSTVISEQREWPHQLTVLFAIPVTEVLSFSQRDVAYIAENYLVNGVGGWIITFLAVVVTSFFIPNLMSKGYLDLFISKPIGRVSLLVYKYIGGLTFMALLTSIAVLGVYLVLGIRTGIWAPNFLLTIPLLTLQFAILYAVSTLFGVLTRSAIVAMLATVAAWLIFFAVGKVNDGIRNREIENNKISEMLKTGKIDEFDENGRRQSREEIQRDFDPNRPLWSIFPTSWFPVMNAVHNVFPRTFQLDSRIGRVIAQGVLTERQQKQRGWDIAPAESWPELLGVNFAFIALMLGLASWRFVTRDG